MALLLVGAVWLLWLVKRHLMWLRFDQSKHAQLEASHAALQPSSDKLCEEAKKDAWLLFPTQEEPECLV